MDNPEQNHSEGPNLRPIGCVSTLLSNIRRIKKFEIRDAEKQEAEETLLYYRGQSNACWKLEGDSVPGAGKSAKAILKDYESRQEGRQEGK